MPEAPEPDVEPDVLLPLEPEEPDIEPDEPLVPEPDVPEPWVPDVSDPLPPMLPDRVDPLVEPDVPVPLPLVPEPDVPEPQVLPEEPPAPAPLLEVAPEDPEVPPELEPVPNVSLLALPDPAVLERSRSRSVLERLEPVPVEVLEPDVVEPELPGPEVPVPAPEVPEDCAKLAGSTASAADAVVRASSIRNFDVWSCVGEFMRKKRTSALTRSKSAAVPGCCAGNLPETNSPEKSHLDLNSDGNEACLRYTS